jgi:hypothetical protein
MCEGEKDCWIKDQFGCGNCVCFGCQGDCSDCEYKGGDLIATCF